MQVQIDVAQLRAKYRRAGITELEMNPDPMRQFERWYAEWRSTGPIDASAVAFATADPALGPSVRLMRLAAQDHGFVIYTDAASRKASELAKATRAAMCFAWLELARQVRVVGAVESLEPLEVDNYFRVQPKQAQLVAWVSDQHTVQADREGLVTRLDEMNRRFAEGQIPRPDSWIGYRLIPDEIEFWQGRVDLLADRLRYRRASFREGWVVERVAP